MDPDDIEVTLERPPYGDEAAMLCEACDDIVEDRDIPLCADCEQHLDDETIREVYRLRVADSTINNTAEEAILDGYSTSTPSNSHVDETWHSSDDSDDSGLIKSVIGKTAVGFGVLFSIACFVVLAYYGMIIAVAAGHIMLANATTTMAIILGLVVCYIVGALIARID